MTINQLCNIGNTPSKPLKIIDIETDLETGVTLFVHQLKSFKGSIAQNAMRLRYFELMKYESNLNDKKQLKDELLEELSREMYATLIDGWDGVDEDFDMLKAIDILKKSTVIALQVKHFSEQSGKSLKKSESDL